MSDLFDFEPKLDEYAVLGNPISHSKSPAIHAAFAEQTRQRIHYSAIHVDMGGFSQAVGNFFAAGGKGLNITVPFKQEAWKLAELHSERATAAGAVNTLLMRNEQLYADNTDGVGLTRDLINNLGLVLTDKRILLLGAGGAARGVILPLLDENPAVLRIANRSPEKAIELAALFSDAGNIMGSSFTNLKDKPFDLIINATSASLHGEIPPVSISLLAENAVCYDMMYAAKPTTFLQWGMDNGVKRCRDGLGMLVEQAAESFLLWRGVMPETKPVIDMIRASLH